MERGETCERTGFFDASPGNRSSSRLTSFIVVMAALAMSEQIIIFAYILGTDILLAAASAGTTFITIGGASMYYMYNQKKQETPGNQLNPRTVNDER